MGPRCVREALAGAMLARARRGLWLLGRIKEGYEKEISAWTFEVWNFVSEDTCLEG